MKEIPLRAKDGSIRAYALVDDEDFKWLSRWRWCCPAGYVVRSGGHKGFPTVRMHRQIMGLEVGDPREVDHRDGNGLDNQRSNLRIVTHAQNGQNKVYKLTCRPPTSKYRNVYWNRPTEKWRVVVQVAGVKFYLGQFEDEDEAADAARAFRNAHYTHNNEERHEVA